MILGKNTEKPNKEIRNYAKSKSVKLWQLADRLGIQESSLSKKLRTQFDDETIAHVCKLIDEIAEAQ